MKQLVVLSGKGGTGKTSISAALAYVIQQQMQQSLVIVDADVDAANLALLYHPDVQMETLFQDAEVAHIEADQCAACGSCKAVCRFDAVIPGEPYTIDPIACEGCAACTAVCPTNAITMQEEASGKWYISQSQVGTMLHAELNPGGENSGKLVSLLKQQGMVAAEENRAPVMLVDGPPGTGCPAIAACSGADLALLVTEPGLAAFHDLKRIHATAKHFNLPCVLCINKANINPVIKLQIMTWAAQENIPLVGEIDFDEQMLQCVLQGELITHAYPQSQAAQQIQAIWPGVQSALGV
jgi:MinD superfamily P-loop ATPase